ncbi:MAG TPA: tetratricopeptide repeat protein, partial [Pyrinomonadaceae bacterium]|nr:tetratricopeptide repeat protein [Pyrinomonadaceae bacterium]
RRELDAQPEPATVELQRQIESGLFRPRDTVNTQGTIESIAILPLQNSSGDPEMEYLSDGLTENIINNLSQLPALRVMAWGTVARFKGCETTPAEVGRSLGVRVVLTGRMLQLGERLIVRAELIDAADGAHLWGDAYDRTLADIFAMQEDIASEISENLRLKLTGEEKQRLTKRHTESTFAYHAYLKGRYYWNKRTTEWLRKGVEQFRQAIDLDPSYASAYAGLSDSYTLLVVREALKPEEGLAKAKAAASMALAIDESFGEAHASLGHAMLHNWEWSVAEKELKRAIEINPRYPTAHHWYSEYLAAKGAFEAAIRAAKRSEELDPLSLIITVNVADVLYFARQYDQAIKQIERVLELDSPFWLTHMVMGKSQAQRGLYAEAIDELQKAEELLAGDAEVLSVLSFAYAAAGRRSEALKTLQQLKEQAKRHLPTYHFAIIHAGLGEKEQAFDWLERAFEMRAVDLFNLKVEPMFDSLRQDPRFPNLLRRVGLE